MLKHNGYFSMLRTLPIFVSVHTLCPSCKAWLTRNTHADNDIDVINYVTKSGTKMKAKFLILTKLKTWNTRCV